MNPWTDHVVDTLRRIMRFVLWSCAFVSCLMLSIFLVCFTCRFLQHLWSWCGRVLFADSW